MPAASSWCDPRAVWRVLLLCLLLVGVIGAGVSRGHAVAAQALHPHVVATLDPQHPPEPGACQGAAHCAQPFLPALPAGTDPRPPAAGRAIFRAACLTLPPGLCIGPARHPPRHVLP